MTDPRLAAALDGLDRLIAESASEALPGLIGALETAKAKAWARLTTPNGTPKPDTPDENLNVQEAARRLGVSKDWLYKNARRLPFCVRIGRRLLFSARGLERWNRLQQCR